MGISVSAPSPGSSTSRKFSYSIICLAFLLLSIFSNVAAYEITARDSILFKRLEREGRIHIDPRPSPAVNNPVLVARETSSATVSSVSTAATSKSIHSSSGSATASALATSTLSSANGTSVTGSATASSTSSTSSTPTALPTPFDTSLGNNFTAQACPQFFQSFLNNATFKSCLPVSLLLQNSIGFFKATRAPKFLDTVLDASCSASMAICSPLMSSIANNLILDANCGADYRRQNPIVTQAYTGLLAYEPLYNATCLENKVTGNYCFVDAVSNNTNAGDLYPYYTALGIPLPASAQPTCNTCLQQTMNIFAGYAQQKQQPLSKTYIACAVQVDSTCGPTFANADVKVATVSANQNSSPKTGTSRLLVATTALLASWYFLV